MSIMLFKNALRPLEKTHVLWTSTRFTSTISSSAKVGPEHPYFIDVPGQAPRQRPLRKCDMKGTLPPPRDVLKTRALRIPKNDPEFTLKTTPEPKKKKKQQKVTGAAAAAQNEYEAWKRRMAESRKKNLRESITELYKRKIERQNTLAALSRGRRKRREILVRMPQREDERLTQPTITQHTSTLQRGTIPDPNRGPRIAEKVARVKGRDERRMLLRRQALHTLYMNARYFIVTEKQLDERIQHVFIPTPFREHDLNDNIWEFGSPPTVLDLLKKFEGDTKLATEAYESPAVRIGERMLTIAEELTGGKIEIEDNIVDKM